jgi:hypothetical protein
VRVAILVASLFATAVARAEVEPVKEPRFDDLSAVSGFLFPRGAFIEQRNCGIKRDFLIGCAHMLYGKQIGGAKKDGTVFDLYATSGVVLRRGRFDVTSLMGVSILTTTLYIGQWLIAPVSRSVPSASETFSLFPFTASASVALGYTFVRKGSFRSRAELAVRGHVPLFTESTIELPTPKGIGATIGIGAGF